MLPAIVLLVVTRLTKLASGWVAAGQVGASRRGRIRAGTARIARGEFSIVIASLGVGLDEGAELGVLAAAYLLLTAVLGPIATKNADALSGSFNLPKRSRGAGVDKSTSAEPSP